MGNKVNYIQAIFYQSVLNTARPKKLKKIRQDPEVWDCDSFQ